MLNLTPAAGTASGFPSDNDVTIAESAWRLAPQFGTTAFDAAQPLMYKEPYLEAAHILAPLTNNPHGGDSLTSERTLLAEAREQAGLGSASVEAPPDADAATEAGTPEDEGPEGEPEPPTPDDGT